MKTPFSRTARRAFAFAGLFVTLASAPVMAQPRPLQKGEEVRVRWMVDYASAYTFAASQSIMGEVVDVNPAAVIVRRGNRLITVPMNEVRSIQRRVGTKPTSAPAMVAGSASGFAAGFLVGALTGGLNHGAAQLDRVDAGLTTGVLIGAPLGAFVAWLSSRSRGIYEDVPFGDILSKMTVRPDGSIGISVGTDRF